MLALFWVVLAVRVGGFSGSFYPIHTRGCFFFFFAFLGYMVAACLVKLSVEVLMKHLHNSDIN